METIRQFDRQSQITLICDEPAHSRMALPYWLAGKVPQEHTYTASAESLRQLNVTWCGNVRAPDLHAAPVGPTRRRPYDPLRRTAHRDWLETHGIAGSGADLPGVQHVWTLADTQRILDAAAHRQPPRVVFVGAGFIGLIVLNALHQRGWQLAVVEQADQILPRMLTAPATARTTMAARKAGRGALFQSSRVHLRRSRRLQMRRTEQRTAIGSRPGHHRHRSAAPTFDLTHATHIQTDVGILVDDRLQTSEAGSLCSRRRRSGTGPGQ